MRAIYLALTALIASFVLVRANNPPTSEVLWDRYQTVLMSFIRKNNDPNMFKGLQVVTEQLEAMWEDDQAMLSHFMDKSARYGSVYEPSTVQLSQEYESFLLNLKFPQLASNPADQAKLTALRTRLEAAEEERLRLEMDCFLNYDVMKTIMGDLTFTSFRASYCAPVLGPLTRKLNEINSDLTTLTTRVNGPDRKIVDGLSNFITNPSVGQFVETTTSLRSFLDNARNKRGNPVSFALNSKTVLSENRKWIKKKSSGFIFKKKSTTIKTEHRFQSEDFEMKISGDSFARIEIAPKDGWYSADIVSSYFNRKTMWERQDKSFFGPNGTLTLLPKAIYVMYNPKVTLRCGEKDAYALSEFKQTSFSFGPFSSQKGSTLEVKKVNEQNYNVEFNSNSDVAQIIAIDYQVFE